MQILKWIGPLAWAWLIFIGGLMITPGGPVPINTTIAIISIVLGVGALATRFMSSGR